MVGSSALQNIFKIPELKRRIFYTFGLLAVYRIGVHVPTPGIDTVALASFFAKAQGTLLGLFDMFSGGALQRLSVFALGIMPYISASIILQLLTVVIPHLERLSKEGSRGGKRSPNIPGMGRFCSALSRGSGSASGWKA
jgi:preprotein translocase subunit SecY